MLRAVFDTVVFVRALINPHSRCGRLLGEHSSRFQMVVSEPIVRELLEVLRRPELTLKYRGLSEMNIRRIIDLLAQAESVQVTAVPAIGRDPKDDIFIATALAGRVDYLVSEDNDLLVLGDTTGIPIVDARTFIALFESGI
jgi:putative PIN family toxin of toxin-antitoxin system